MILNVFKFSARSIKLRGFLVTIKLFFLEIKFEKYYGIKTGSVKFYGRSPYFYQGAPYYALHKVMAEVKEIVKDFSFMDIGCGKGRVLIVAEAFGFKNIYGVEYNNSLLQEAKQNIKNRKFKNMQTIFTLQETDAREVNYPPVPTVYFMFNPFNEQILESVLNKILQANSSKKIFIYMNPVHQEVFGKVNLKAFKKIYTHHYLEALIYES